MFEKRIRKKTGSILIIVFLICSGLLIALPLNPEFHEVSAASTWVQESAKNFKNGTLDNLTIEGSGEDAVLKIDLSDQQTWTKVRTSNSPISGYNAMASIYGDDKVVVFGGYWYWYWWTGYWYSNKTWIYDLSENDWTWVQTTSGPYYRYWHAMASIWGEDSLLLFGGNPTLSDTWMYDVSDRAWNYKTLTTSPSGRFGHGMSSIWGKKMVLLFGGSSFYNDTWVYDFNLNNWIEKTPLFSPDARYFHAMASIDGDDKVVLFGGQDSMGGLLNDTWIYDLNLNTWTKKTTLISPSARAYHAMAPIYGTDQVILCGGELGAYNDIWVYDVGDNSWSQKFPTNPEDQPSSMYSYGIAPIYGTDLAVVYGGNSGYYSSYNEDTWIYNHVSNPRNGTFISASFDTGYNPDFTTLTWEANIPDETSIGFQLRTAVDQENLSTTEFIGPEGTSSTYYTSSPSDIWSGHNGDRWIQYKAYFNMDIFTESPTLDVVEISYNCLPSVEVIGPINGSLLTDNKPTFTWKFNDPDDEPQKAFQIVIDDNPGFASIDYDTSEQSTQEQQWTFPMGTDFVNLEDGTWYWKVRTEDADDTWTDYSLPQKLVIDTQPPSSMPVSPCDNDFCKSLQIISGIATETTTGSGINNVEISVRNLNTNRYLAGTNWITTKTWLLTSGTVNWSYDIGFNPWISGQRYIVQSRATDLAGNIENTDNFNIFTIDEDKPSSNIISPMDNIWLTTLTSISGISVDNGGSGIEKTELSIQCSKDNKFWDGTDWNMSKCWLTAKGTNQWSYDTSAIPWEPGSIYQWYNKPCYTVTSRATDKVSNIGNPSTSITIWFDDQPPGNLSIVINNGAEYSANSQVSLSIQADEIESGISQMSFSLDSNQWSNWEPFNETKLYELPLGDGDKFVHLRVCDCMENVAEPVYDKIILDTTPPQDLFIFINKNVKYTNSTEVELDLHAIDASSGINQMSFYNSIKWTSNEPFKSTKSLVLPSGDGEKIIYFRVSDKVGNIAEVYGTIILDSTAPYSSWILINNGALETNSTFVNLKLNALDNTSGISEMSFSSDGKEWSSWEPYKASTVYNLQPGDGTKTIYFRVKDFAGNIAEPTSASIIINTKTQTEETKESKESTISMEFWALLILIIILIIIQIISLYFFKKQKSTLPRDVSAEPEILPKRIEPATQVQPAPTLARLPDSATTSIDQELSTTIISTPALAKTTDGTSVPISKFPQLPPGDTTQEIEVKVNGSQPTPKIEDSKPPTI